MLFFEYLLCAVCLSRGAGTFQKVAAGEGACIRS